MKQLACAVAVVALALTGCGGSFCDDSEDTGKSFYDKTKACPSLNDGSAYTAPTEAEKQQCEDDLKSCSDDDKKALSKFLDCVDALPTCTAATEQSFTNSFAGCALPLANISSACSGAIANETARKGFEMIRAH
jgi:hypothetical protein